MVMFRAQVLYALFGYIGYAGLVAFIVYFGTLGTNCLLASNRRFSALPYIHFDPMSRPGVVGFILGIACYRTAAQLGPAIKVPISLLFQPKRACQCLIDSTPLIFTRCKQTEGKTTREEKRANKGDWRKNKRKSITLEFSHFPSLFWETRFIESESIVCLL